MLVPRGLSRIQEVAGSISDSPFVTAGLRACFVDATRACIGENHRDLALLAHSAILALDSRVLPRTCDAGQEIDCRVGLSSLAMHLILRQIDHERHLAVVAIAPVLNCLDEASKRLFGFDHFYLIGSLGLEFVYFNHSAKTSALVHRVDEIINFVEPIKVVGHVV